MNILATIKASEDFRKLADAGHDAQLADELQATIPAVVPITAGMLAQAAPQTMQSIAGGQNPLSEMEVVAARTRAQDWLGIGAWADMLLMLGKMPQAEYDAVEELVKAAVPGETVSATQVTAELATIRPQTIERVDADGNPVLDDDGHAINDIVPSGGVVRALPIDWSLVP